jgi:hypothetical protein
MGSIGSNEFSNASKQGASWDKRWEAGHLHEEQPMISSGSSKSSNSSNQGEGVRRIRSGF